METLKAFGKAIPSVVQSYPKGALIVWGASLIAVFFMMWG